MMESKSQPSTKGAQQPPETTDSTTPSTTPSTATTNPDAKSSTSQIPLPKKVTSSTPTVPISPKPSRETSPMRPSVKTTTSARAGRSGKNSSQEVSPARSTSASANNPPSAAAVQRALSSANFPPLPPAAVDPSSHPPTPQKSSVPPEIREAPKWPVSPRLRSPPPSQKAVSGQHKPEVDSPEITIQSATPTGKPSRTGFDGESEEGLNVPGSRTPARGVSGASSTLETVQEISQPNTPAVEVDNVLDKKDNDGKADPTEHVNVVNQPTHKSTTPKNQAAASESGSESGGTKADMKMRATSLAPNAALRATTVPTSKSFTNATALARGKPSGEGSTKNMIVETETVSSIPQVAVGGGTGSTGGNGSLRTKPSSETIRPKKEKKKTTRKPPSVASGTGEPPTSIKPKLHHHHSTRSVSDVSSFASPTRPDSSGPSPNNIYSGPGSPRGESFSRRPSNFCTVGSMLTRHSIASSKADIFEAKIASAVDEADSSDSDETFVYESNPPDTNDRPRRFHSRTPSATSMASQVDQRGGSRSIQGVLDNGHTVAMKKSMKFANSYTNPTSDSGFGDDDGLGTVRTSAGTGRGTTHHHHIGRWGRNSGNGHQSIFDNESPFPNVAKPKLSGPNSRQSSRPSSPRVANFKMGNGRKNSPISLGYDIDDGARADDERTPLMPATIRSNRSGRNRRPLSGSMRQFEHQQSRRNQYWLTRVAGCLVLSIMIVLVISGAIGFMFATTQPLSEVKILGLRKILASGQELILDMDVMARNPNVMAVAVESASLDIFAKSKYAGTDSGWWKHHDFERIRNMRHGNRRDDLQIDDDLVIKDLDNDKDPLLLLGRIDELDSPLVFDGSPFKHQHAFATGQVRLSKPGNSTKDGGTARWERVLKYEFELIVRGTLKYQLPMSQRIRSLTVDGSAVVKPQDDEKGATEPTDDDVHIIV